MALAELGLFIRAEMFYCGAGNIFYCSALPVRTRDVSLIELFLFIRRPRCSPEQHGIVDDVVVEFDLRATRDPLPADRQLSKPQFHGLYAQVSHARHRRDHFGYTCVTKKRGI